MIRLVERNVSESARNTLIAGGVHPVLARVYAARGIDSVSDLDYGLLRLAPPTGMSGIEAATRIVGEAVVRGTKTALAGDYDVDGASASAILYEAITAFGGAPPACLIPSRFSQGYGLSPALVDAARETGARLIITVDNGITAFEAIDYANSLGITVVVTDHHPPAVDPEGAVKLPSAAAIVNPNVPGCGFPWKTTCGAGVAFYLATAVRVWLRWCGHPGGQARLGPLLDLVALATVADVVPLDRNNRIFVTQGLARIRAGARPGIAALFSVAGRDIRMACSEDLGFVAGPRLNAAGRLASMDLGVRLLLERDPAVADGMAHELDRLNQARRSVESDAVDDALSHLPDGADPTERALVFFGEEWHEGVVGLVASRLRERFHRPVIALCVAQDGTLKGSGRSVTGLHLRDALARVAEACPGLIRKFGGHAMAAGLTLERDQLGLFRTVFGAITGRMVPDFALQPVLWSDGELCADLTVETARAVRDGGPWGNGFEEPVFHGSFRVVNYRILKDAHRALTLERGGQTFRAIQFHNSDKPPAEAVFSYIPHVDTWMGEDRLQLVVQHVHP